MKVFKGLPEFRSAVGSELGLSEWRTIDQAMINAFGELTDDRQWIHMDPDRAATGPMGGTIAHGFLTLSLVPAVMNEVYRIDHLAMGINYGLDRVRFPAPVPSGSRIRGRVELSAYKGDDSSGTATVVVSFEREGETTRPVCVAHFLMLLHAAA